MNSNKKPTHIFDELLTRYPHLAGCRDDIQKFYDLLVNAFRDEKRLYICGNGGSAADALHITGELVKSFTQKRPLDNAFTECMPNNSTLTKNLQGALPVFALVENISLSTAFGNDCNPEYIFAQQVYAYARRGDCVLGISTSGNSENIIHAIDAAKGRGAVTLGLTGADGGILKKYCDACICVHETEVYKIQELHLPVYHALCMALENEFF